MDLGDVKNFRVSEVSSLEQRGEATYGLSPNAYDTKITIS
jgi:hypothetical protein